MLHKWFVNSCVALLVVELLSWLSYSYPETRTAITMAILFVVLALSCYRLEWGIAAVLGELVVGSQGYLLAITSPVTISLRLGLFAVVFLATGVWILRDRRIALLQTNYWKWYLTLVCILGVAVLTAWWYGNDPKAIFLDANGYLFMAMLVPFVQAIRHKQTIYQLGMVLLAGVVILTLQTVVILFIYSHPSAFTNYIPDLYRWLRDFRLAEISPQDNNFTRVFFQSHIYVVLAFILASIAYIKAWKQWWILPLLSTTLTLILICQSRSFWAATLVIIGALAVLAGKRAWRYLVLVGLGLAGGFLLTLVIINVPLLGAGSGVDASSLLTDRTSDLTTDVGGGSRMALFMPLAKAAGQHPLLGSGFGTTVTYATKDYRALANSTDGLYTTYAFEWGYLDLWLKLGLIGTALYGLIILAVVVRLYQHAKGAAVIDQVVLWTAAGGLLAISIVHMLTPYLNHPLGIGWITLATAIAATYDKITR